MKKPAVALLLFIFLLPLLHGQKTRFGQSLSKAKPGVAYPLALHFSAMSIHTECEVETLIHPRYLGSDDCEDVMYADAVVNGKKIELKSNSDQYREFSYDKKPPLLGDYQARITTKNPGPDVNSIGLKYEVLLHDGTVLSLSVTGVFE